MTIFIIKVKTTNFIKWWSNLRQTFSPFQLKRELFQLKSVRFSTIVKVTAQIKTREERKKKKHVLQANAKINVV